MAGRRRHTRGPCRQGGAAELEGMYAAGARPLAAGDPGGADFTEPAPCFAADVVPTRVRAAGRRTGFPMLPTVVVEDGPITEVRPSHQGTAAVADACAVPGQ
ncbi:hypothetical protein [Nocardiopsis sp. CA-288880]|uniref:hypothetical protein n=1 Tax=Nocardiopsis sp. CA-288880 TaxID=3239995 RepID=UPI003D99C53F